MSAMPSSGLSSPIMSSNDLSTSSLAVNYLPDKFSRAPSGIHNRKGRGGVPKLGGGREAFRQGEARMPGNQDVDYDGVDWLGAGGKAKPKMRWNKFKWILFASNLLLLTYSIIALVFCLLTWFNIWHKADIVRVSNQLELIVSTIAAGVGIVTSLIGWSGILLNNRAFLAVYTLMLWVTFALILIPGYFTCRRREYNLEGKINAQWSRVLGITGRLRIQNQLQCCGYFSPFVEATISQACYSRSTLPGCKGPFLDFQRKVLQRWYIAVFGLVPIHIGVMLAAILCSNHVTYRFGKGMMPKAYRLSKKTMAVLVEQYASQLTDQYGSKVPTDYNPSTPNSDPSRFVRDERAPTGGYAFEGPRATAGYTAPPQQQRKATYPPPDAYAGQQQHQPSRAYTFAQEQMPPHSAASSNGQWSAGIGQAYSARDGGFDSYVPMTSEPEAYSYGGNHVRKRSIGRNGRSGTAEGFNRI